MWKILLKSKIHCARVTDANLHYEGSIDIDSTLANAAGLVEYEKVLVANFTNGNRYETYVMLAEPNSGTIGVNGGGARYSCIGDEVTIFAFSLVEEHEDAKPTIVLLNEDNSIKEVRK